jgi:hypothetical protein
MPAPTVYIEAADFRSTTLAEYCAGLVLSTADVSDDDLIDAAIVRVSAQFDDWTNDDFLPSEDDQTYDLDGGGGRKLFLPRRCTVIDTVSIRDDAGDLTELDPDVYRLTTSLDSEGVKAVGDYDYLEIVPGQSVDVSLSTTQNPAWDRYASGSVWPEGPQTVQVVGTFGWAETPGDVKRACAILVYDHFKPVNPNLRRADRWATPEGASFSSSLTEPTGLPEVDEVIARRRRPTIPVL